MYASTEKNDSSTCVSQKYNSKICLTKHTYQLLCFKQFVMFFRSCLCSKDLQLLVHKATRLPKALYQAWQQGLQRTLSVDMPRQRSDFELLNQKTFNTCSTSFVYDTLYIYIYAKRRNCCKNKAALLSFSKFSTL